MEGDRMSVYGYHRTSTAEQHLDRGLHEIANYCQQHDINRKKLQKNKIGIRRDMPKFKG